MKNEAGSKFDCAFYKFDTVTDLEVSKLLMFPKFKNLFKLINEFSLYPGAPKSWLLTSIDTSSSDGKPRYGAKSANHFDSHAVDIVPLSNDLVIRLPIPLNRNYLLMKLFRQLGSEMFNSFDLLPIIAFEADHIHCDINNQGGFFYLNETRSFMDSAIHRLVTSVPLYKSALSDKKLIPIV